MALLAIGLLLGSEAFRKRIGEIDKQMVGEAGDEWALAASIAKSEEARTEFVTTKAGGMLKDGLSLEANLLRAFVRSEATRRLERVDFLLREYRRFAPQEAAATRSTREELEKFLAQLEE